MGAFAGGSWRVLVVLTVFVLVAAGTMLAPGPAAGARAASGAFIWERTPDRTRDVSNSLSFLSAGPSGTVYAAGVRGAADQSRTWLVKYLPGGRRAWSRAWGDTGGGSSTRNQAAALAVDGAGNAYVVACHRDGLDWSTVLASYDATGALLWETAGPAVSYRSPPACALGIDAAVHKATDASGSLSADTQRALDALD